MNSANGRARRSNLSCAEQNSEIKGLQKRVPTFADEPVYMCLMALDNVVAIHNNFPERH